MKDKYIGEYRVSLTEKNRIAIPKDLRPARPMAEEAVYISTFNVGWLEVYPESAWVDMISFLDSIPRVNSDLRDFARMFFSQTYSTVLDKQGRFVLNQKMLENLMLRSDDNELLFLGAGDRIELWEPRRWAIKQSSLQRDSGGIMDRLSFLAAKISAEKI